MKEIKELPAWDWSNRAKAQMLHYDAETMLQSSYVAYQLGTAAVVGLIYVSLLAPPWLWFALASEVTMRDLIDFRRLRDRIPTGALTAIEEDDEIALRFASFHGFVDTGRIIEAPEGNYIIMRKA